MSWGQGYRPGEASELWTEMKPSSGPGDQPSVSLGQVPVLGARLCPPPHPSSQGLGRGGANRAFQNMLVGPPSLPPRGQAERWAVLFAPLCLQ